MTRYEPRHDTQFEPRSALSGSDCNMAACADVGRFYTLRLLDRSHVYYRTLTGDTEGGTNISEAHMALEAAGVPVTGTYDYTDGKGWSDVRAALLGGSVVIAHGYYGSVPASLRGPIDRTFTGLHSVLFHRIDPVHGVRVGDGLNDAWTWWPESVAKAYCVDFPGAGLTYLTVTPRQLAARVPVANVRSGPSLSSGKLGTITPSSRLHAGGTVTGGGVGTNRTWWRVWFHDQIAYVHSSVAHIV